MPSHRDQSFSRKYRLHRSSDFRRVFSRGKRVASRSFVIYSLPNRLSFSRIGIQVRARIGNAVQRNYIKRIVREAFRKRKEEFHEPLDLILIAEKGLAELEYSGFEKEWDYILEKYLR